ncbi:MAG: hypothetical protein ACJ746_16345 [Bryobacteraceae bacterium]
MGANTAVELRRMFALLRYAQSMGKRRCEVSMTGPDGRKHTLTVEANSVSHAAVLFYAQSAAPSPGVKLPKFEMETVLEVSPAYRVRLKDAMEWANREANRANRANGISGKR